MGAQLWQHAAPWHDDPSQALLELQARLLAEAYDLPSLIWEHLESAREAVRLVEAEGDQYGLLDPYREELAMLEDMAARPLPTDSRRQIELVRAIYRNSGQGVGNVLDVTGVSETGGRSQAKRLTPEETQGFCGTDRPILSDAEAAADEINKVLSRGESVCFPIYTADSGGPVGWYFVGNTID